MTAAHSRNIGVAATALLASSATLVCCVVPAVFVSLGAGAALAGLVSAVPQLIWLSEHKAPVFGVAGLLLVISGALLWNSRRLPCPVEPNAARTCARLRSISYWLYGTAVATSLVGALFAFGLRMMER
jgi:hypothetical protein